MTGEYKSMSEKSETKSRIYRVFIVVEDRLKFLARELMCDITGELENDNDNRNT